MASEDVFLKWTQEQGKRYSTRAELTKRRAIFMKNYNRMVAHNQVLAITTTTANAFIIFIIITISIST